MTKKKLTILATLMTVSLMGLAGCDKKQTASDQTETQVAEADTTDESGTMETTKTTKKSGTSTTETKKSSSTTETKKSSASTTESTKKSSASTTESRKTSNTTGSDDVSSWLYPGAVFYASGGSSGSSNTSATATEASTTATTTESSTTAHTHTWTKTSYDRKWHDEVGHYETQSVKVSDAYDEKVYETHAVCQGCGYDHTANGKPGGSTHISLKTGDWCDRDGWSEVSVYVGTVHHDAEYEDQQVWVVDKEPYFDVITVYTCTKCGATKEENSTEEW